MLYQVYRIVGAVRYLLGTGTVFQAEQSLVLQRYTRCTSHYFHTLYFDTHVLEPLPQGMQIVRLLDSRTVVRTVSQMT